MQKKIIERVSSNDISNCKEFYPPHKFVIQKKAESTKLRVVYDASAKSETGFPLNDYLEKRPFFKINCEMYSKVKLSSGTFTSCQWERFLSIRIRESKRDCLKFTYNNKIEIYRLARLVFGWRVEGVGRGLERG